MMMASRPQSDWSIEMNIQLAYLPMNPIEKFLFDQRAGIHADFRDSDLPPIPVPIEFPEVRGLQG
jgi:hypothetical protein